MGGSRSHSEFFFLNHPKIALNQYRYFGVVYHMYYVCINTSKVVSYYDLSVPSMSMMVSKKKKLWMGVGGWGELYPSFFWIFLIFLTLQSPLVLTESCGMIQQEDCASIKRKESLQTKEGSI